MFTERHNGSGRVRYFPAIFILASLRQESRGHALFNDQYTGQEGVSSGEPVTPSNFVSEVRQRKLEYRPFLLCILAAQKGAACRHLDDGSNGLSGSKGSSKLGGQLPVYSDTAALAVPGHLEKKFAAGTLARRLGSSGAVAWRG